MLRAVTLTKQALYSRGFNRGIKREGSKKHILVDGRGVPLSVVVTGANRHDVTQLRIVLESIVADRPEPTDKNKQHLCADKGYTGEPALEIIVLRGYTPNVVSRSI